MQIETAVLTYKAKYILLSSTIKETILLIQLLKDLKKLCNIIITPSEVYYNIFEDNKRYITVIKLKKPSIRIKHIPIKYYHFWGLVDNKVIRINYINTKD